jgi:hypothetical protein
MDISKNKSVIAFAWVVGIVVSCLIFGPSIAESLKASREAEDLRPQLEEDIKKAKREMSDFVEKNSPPMESERIPK